MMNHYLVEGWLDWLEVGNVSPNTLRIRRSALRAFVGHHDPETVTGLEIQHHLASLPGGAYSRQGHLSALRSFFRWLHLSGHRPDNPSLLIRSIKVPEGIPKPVDEITLHRAVEAADNTVRLMLLLGGWAGLRRNEIATFHESCIVGDELQILGKGGVTRRVPTHPRLRPLMDFDGYAFPALRGKKPHIHHDTVAVRVAAALGEPWHTHSLRHRAATQWYRGTKDLRVVQKLLGHSEITTTQRYVMVDEDALHAAVLAVA